MEAPKTVEPEKIRLWHVEMWSKLPRFEEPKELCDFIISKRRSGKELRRLLEQFCPDGCRPQSACYETYCLFAYIASDVFRVEMTPPYEREFDLGKHSILTKKKETQVHKDLKSKATEWLIQEKGCASVSYEERYSAGIADVVSSDGAWYVECGATRPEKVWRFHEAQRGNLVVFNDVGVATFTKGKRFGEYMEAVFRHSKKMAAKVPAL